MAVASSSAVAVVQVALGPYIFVFFSVLVLLLSYVEGILRYLFIFLKREKKNSFSRAAAQRSQCIEVPGNTLQRANLFYVSVFFTRQISSLPPLFIYLYILLFSLSPFMS